MALTSPACTTEQPLAVAVFTKNQVSPTNESLSTTKSVKATKVYGRKAAKSSTHGDSRRGLGEGCALSKI